MIIMKINIYRIKVYQQKVCSYENKITASGRAEAILQSRETLAESDVTQCFSVFNSSAMTTCGYRIFILSIKKHSQKIRTVGTLIIESSEAI